jgi:hypothetical protein
VDLIVMLSKQDLAFLDAFDLCFLNLAVLEVKAS